MATADRRPDPNIPIVNGDVRHCPRPVPRDARDKAIIKGSPYPRARDIIQNFIYVDDVLFGADDFVSLRETRDQLVKLMALGGFHLRK